MDTLFSAFVITAFLIIIIPGPNVLVIVSTSMSEGRRRGLQVVAGTSAAMIIQLYISAVATGWFVDALAEGFAWLRIIGMIYLFYYAVRHFMAMRDNGCRQNQQTATSSFFRGFLVSLANPKTLLFFSAFLPQFVSAEGDYLQQVAVLSACFLGMAMLFDSLYALLAGALMPYLQQQSRVEKIKHGMSGSLYLSAGIWLWWQRKGQ